MTLARQDYEATVATLIIRLALNSSTLNDTAQTVDPGDNIFYTGENHVGKDRLLVSIGVESYPLSSVAKDANISSTRQPLPYRIPYTAITNILNPADDHSSNIPTNLV